MVPYTVEGWSQSNFLECGQTACGKVATTGSQQGHSNPSKHKGIAFIWRIQSTIITNTREPTPRTADYSSASTALHYKVNAQLCHNGLMSYPPRQASSSSSKLQQAAASSRQEASKQQASSKQAASSQPASKPESSKQQQASKQASSSKQQQAAGNSKQQASSSKQAATSVCPLERMNKYKL